MALRNRPRNKCANRRNELHSPGAGVPSPLPQSAPVSGRRPTLASALPPSLRGTAHSTECSREPNILHPYRHRQHHRRGRTTPTGWASLHLCLCSSSRYEPATRSAPAAAFTLIPEEPFPIRFLCSCVGRVARFAAGRRAARESCQRCSHGVRVVAAAVGGGVEHGAGEHVEHHDCGVNQFLGSSSNNQYEVTTPLNFKG